MATEARAEDLENQLESMLDIEKFPPPDDFRKHALVTDESMYEEAAADLEGFWQRQAEELIDWAEKPTQTLDESNAPFYKWFADGKLNVTHNCLDRHVEAGNGDRVAYHWRGEEGEERDITYAELHRDVQRFANALKNRGIGKGDVVGIYLPMIPEVVIAMLACARIGAPHNVVFGGFSPEAVRERMEFSEAKALITVDGARRKGKTAPIKSAVDPEIESVSSIETIFVVNATDTDCEMKEGRDVWFGEEMETADARVPGRAPGRRASALRPLHLRLHREAEGRPAHDRRLPGRRHIHPPLRLRPEAGDRRLLVRRGCRLGHRPLLHRLRPALQRSHERHVRGRSGLPGQGHLVGGRRALQGDHPLHGPHRDPCLHEVGRSTRRSTISHRSACSAPSASRSTPRHGSGTTR